MATSCSRLGVSSPLKSFLSQASSLIFPNRKSSDYSSSRRGPKGIQGLPPSKRVGVNKFSLSLSPLLPRATGNVACTCLRTLALQTPMIWPWKIPSCITAKTLRPGFWEINLGPIASRVLGQPNRPVACFHVFTAPVLPHPYLDLASKIGRRPMNEATIFRRQKSYLHTASATL